MLSSLPTFCDPATAKTLAEEISFALGRTGNNWRNAALAAQFIQTDVKLRLMRCMAGNARQRAAIHVAVVRAILVDYLQLWDDERDVADLVNDAVRELADLAPPATVADDGEKGFRREILREILEIQLWDAYHGGQYMGDTAERRLESLATPEERAWLLAELLASFARYGGPDYQFGRQCVGRIGLNMAGDGLSGEEMEGLLRAAGLSSELAQRLLARGDVEGALEVLRGADGRQVCAIVKAFYAVGQGDIAAKAALLHPALADPECGGLGAELAAVGVEVPEPLLELSCRSPGPTAPTAPGSAAAPWYR